jgi:hypothetical protein
VPASGGKRGSEGRVGTGDWGDEVRSEMCRLEGIGQLLRILQMNVDETVVVPAPGVGRSDDGGSASRSMGGTSGGTVGGTHNCLVSS